MISFQSSVVFITLSLFGIHGSVAGQENLQRMSLFEQLILDTFNSGMFGPIPSAAPLPLQPEAPNAFPESTLEPTVPAASEDVFLLDPTGILEPSVDESPEESFGESVEPSSTDEPEISFVPEGSPEIRVTQEAFATPEIKSSLEPVETFDAFSNYESGTVNGSITIYNPVRINCGSFDARNTFGNDTKQWFNPESFAVEDPAAASHFKSASDTLLYTTYRTTSGRNLTYTIPLEIEGVWRVTLQWAEIVPQFMAEGARVFTVYINGREVDDDVDVFRDSPRGGYSPMIRTYVINAYDPVINILLGQKVGDPVLHALQIYYISPFMAL